MSANAEISLIVDAMGTQATYKSQSLGKALRNRDKWLPLEWL